MKYTHAEATLAQDAVRQLQVEADLFALPAITPSELLPQHENFAQQLGYLVLGADNRARDFTPAYQRLARQGLGLALRLDGALFGPERTQIELAGSRNDVAVRKASQTAYQFTDIVQQQPRMARLLDAQSRRLKTHCTLQDFVSRSAITAAVVADYFWEERVEKAADLILASGGVETIPHA